MVQRNQCLQFQFTWFFNEHGTFYSSGLANLHSGRCWHCLQWKFATRCRRGKLSSSGQYDWKFCEQCARCMSNNDYDRYQYTVHCHIIRCCDEQSSNFHDCQCCMRNMVVQSVARTINEQCDEEVVLNSVILPSESLNKSLPEQDHWTFSVCFLFLF